MHTILPILKVCFIGAYTCLGKTWAKTPLLCQNRIVKILRKRVLKQAVGGVEEKSEIAAIFNKYKDTFDDFIASSDAKSPDYPDFPNRRRLIDKGSRNAPKSKNGFPTFLEEDCLDKDISITSSELTPTIRDS